MSNQKNPPNNTRLVARSNRSIAVLMVILLAGAVTMGAADSATLQFEVEDSSYRALVRMQTSMTPSEIIDSLWSYENIRKMSGYADTLVFLSATDTAQVVKAHFHHLFYKGYSTFGRTRTPGTARLRIDLLEFVHTWDAIPSPRVFQTRYELIASDSATTIEYRQDVTLDREVGWLSSRIAKRQLKRFQEQLELLVSSWEQNNERTGK